MITAEQIKKIVADAIAGTEAFIVSIHVGLGNSIHIEVDTPAGISVNECLKVSRAVEGSLDREKEDFSLEVTSPGLDKPLRIPQQYSKNIGREVRVVTREGREITGELIAADDAGFQVKEEKTIRNEKKKKELVSETFSLPYDHIKSTHIIISFK